LLQIHLKACVLLVLLLLLLSMHLLAAATCYRPCNHCARHTAAVLVRCSHLLE
jgi:hypothetical protein